MPSFLVVDDQVAIAWGLAKALARAYPTGEVRVAHSTQQALEILRTFRPDLITTDIGRPREDPGGYGFLERLRADPITASVPVIAATAQITDEAKLEQSGFDAVFIKPFAFSDLLDTVERLLHRPADLEAIPPEPAQPAPFPPKDPGHS